MSAWICIRRLLTVIPPSTCRTVSGIPLSWFMASSSCKQSPHKHCTVLPSARKGHHKHCTVVLSARNGVHHKHCTVPSARKVFTTQTLYCPISQESVHHSTVLSHQPGKCSPQHCHCLLDREPSANMHKIYKLSPLQAILLIL